MTQNPNRHYIYIYLDQRKPGEWKYKEHVFKFQPFYVGKGTGYRDIEHLTPRYLAKIHPKSFKIKKIIAQTGEEPIHYRIYENLSEVDAFKIEIELIKHFGRHNTETGILTNLTDGGEGTINICKKSKESFSRKKSKKIYQYSLDGDFIKEWESRTEVTCYFQRAFGPTAAMKRKGTQFGYIWTNKYEGTKIEGREACVHHLKYDYKNIKQIDRETGKVIAVYEDMRKITEAFPNLFRSHKPVRKCLMGKCNSAYGYYWSILDGDKIIVPLNESEKKRKAHKIIKKLPSGEIIKEYKNLPEAMADSGLSYKKISGYYNGTKIDPDGFIWESNDYPTRKNKS